MTVPSRNQQVRAVVEFLNSELNQDRSLDLIATEIVDGYHEMLLAGVKKPATPLREGMLLKSPFDAKVRRVVWIDDEAPILWIVHETSSYGWLGPVTSPAWSFCEEFRPKRRVEVDGKGKMVEMTDEEIAEAWSNPGWSVGDRVSQFQRVGVYEVIATGPQCVLMKHALTGMLAVDSNKSLAQYYKREHQW